MSWEAYQKQAQVIKFQNRPEKMNLRNRYSKLSHENYFRNSENELNKSIPKTEIRKLIFGKTKVQKSFIFLSISLTYFKFIKKWTE